MAVQFSQTFSCLTLYLTVKERGCVIILGQNLTSPQVRHIAGSKGKLVLRVYAFPLQVRI